MMGESEVQDDDARLVGGGSLKVRMRQASFGWDALRVSSSAL